MFARCVLIAALGFTSGSALAQSIERCELNGEALPKDFSQRMIAGKSGVVRCVQAGKITREEEIRDGKWVGLRKTYRSGGGRTEEAVDENGRRNGLQRDYYANGNLRAERTIRSNAIKVGREQTYYESGKPESIAFYADGFQESIEYGPTGCISAVHCQTQGNRLPETREICGFGKAVVETKLCDAVETYAKGVRVKFTRYSERYPLRVVSQVAIERGVKKFKSYYPDGRLESESEEAVDASGNPRVPTRRSIKEYDRRGQLRSHVGLDDGLDTQDWWSEGGTKLREIRSARARKDGIDVIVVTTRTFDAQGRMVSERRENRLSELRPDSKTTAKPSKQPIRGRLRYEPVVECVDAAGKTSFSLGRCPASGPGGPLRQVKHEPRSTPANWAEIKERWAIEEEQLMAYEKNCLKGDRVTCDMLQGLRYETPATLDLKGRDVEKKCRQGDEFACKMLVKREEGLGDLMSRCDTGDKQMCKRLSNLSQ